MQAAYINNKDTAISSKVYIDFEGVHQPSLHCIFPTETMGQEQSQPSASQRPPEPQLSEEERAKLQAEVWSWYSTILATLTSPKMRANQQAALDKRLNQPRKSSPAGAQSSRKPTALEEASRENIGWRNADAQAEFRNWN